VEPDAKREPAQSAYWERRHRLQQAERQARSG
jgi:hypothetical protein